MAMPHVGDWGTIIRGVIKDEDLVVVNLTNSTGVTVSFKRSDQTTVLAQTAVITNVPGTDGKVHFVVPELLLLFTVPGIYKAEFFVTFPDGYYATDVVTFEVGDIIQ